MIRIRVNGQEREVAEGETISGLIGIYNLTPDKVAVEVNRRLVRAAGYGAVLKEGDEVELVTFVGGG